MEIEHPENFSLNDLEGLYLWKYLDLFKLIDLVTSKKLFFQRLDKFEDGLEGLTGEAISILDPIKNHPPYNKKIVNPSLDPLSKQSIILFDQKRRKKLGEIIENSQKTQFANCWFLGNKESLSMWKVYSKSDGLALKFNAKQLTEAVLKSTKKLTNSDFKKLYYGKIDYKNLWPFDPHEKFDGLFNGLKKDSSYLSENEFRFVSVLPLASINSHEFFKLPIGDLKNFDLEIITNPFMESWKIEGIQNLLMQFNLQDKWHKSQMKVKIN